MYLTPALRPLVSVNSVPVPSMISTPSDGPIGATPSPRTMRVAAQSIVGLTWVPWILSSLLVLWLVSWMLALLIGSGSGVPISPGLPSRLE